MAIIGHKQSSIQPVHDWSLHADLTSLIFSSSLRRLSVKPEAQDLALGTCYRLLAKVLSRRYGPAMSQAIGPVTEQST